MTSNYKLFIYGWNTNIIETAFDFNSICPYYICINYNEIFIILKNKDNKSITTHLIYNLESNQIIQSNLALYHNVNNISCGFDFTVYSDNDKNLWYKKQDQITSISSGITISSIACGYDHTLLIGSTVSDKHNVLYSYGCGMKGQLGIGKSIEWNDLEKCLLTNDDIPICIAASLEYSMVITKPNGYLYTFGRSTYCNTFNANIKYENDLIPTLVNELTNVGNIDSDFSMTGLKLCSCSVWHSIAIAEGTNDVFGWGWNKFGQIGIKNNTDYLAYPERITDLDSNNILGEDSNEDIVSLSCGNRHTALLSASGKVIIMGCLGIDNPVKLSRNSDQSIQADVIVIDHMNSTSVAVNSYQWGLAVITNSSVSIATTTLK